METPLVTENRTQILNESDCTALLQQHHLGRVAFSENDRPIILPVNYVLLDGAVVFRTDAGGKLDAAQVHQSIAFEIDGIDALTRTGWSVLVRGVALRVTAPAQLAALHKLPLVAWAEGAKPHFVRIGLDQMTGRRISATELPSQWWG